MGTITQKSLGKYYCTLHVCPRNQIPNQRRRSLQQDIPCLPVVSANESRDLHGRPCGERNAHTVDAYTAVDASTISTAPWRDTRRCTSCFSSVCGLAVSCQLEYPQVSKVSTPSVFCRSAHFLYLIFLQTTLHIAPVTAGSTIPKVLLYMPTGIDKARLRSELPRGQRIYMAVIH